MARTLNTSTEIDNYVTDVLAQARHHAHNVELIIQPLATEVRNRLGPNDTIEVYERNGTLARTCWITISNKRYCFTYDYSDHSIALRDRSLQGTLRFTFDNKTTLNQIRQQIMKL